VPHTRKNIDAEIRRSLSAIAKLKNASAKEFVDIVNQLRERVILSIVQTGEINPVSADTIKAQVDSILSDYERRLDGSLSENQRRLFVKGLQVVDKAVTSANLMLAVPYLSQQVLEQTQKYGATLITKLTDEARGAIAGELDLAVLGQKSMQDVIRDIGPNLKSPSIFRSIARRAEIIARTEVNRIERMATQDRLEQVQKQIPDLKKQWFHSHVGVPRPGHLDLHRITVNADEKFRLSGENGRVYMIDGPYDPILPAGETISCRCVAVPVVGRFQRE